MIKQFLLVLMLLASPCFGAYSRKIAITLDHLQVGASDFTNYTLTIRVTNAELATVANGGLVTSGSGYDLICSSSNTGASVLNFQRDKWVATTGETIIHCLIPTVSHTVDTVVYLVYGDPGTTTDQSNPTATFNSNQKGIYHLGDGTTISGTDSTATLNLTNSGATAVAGQISGGAAFSGTAQSMATASAPMTAVPLTISGWFNSAVGGGSVASITRCSDATGIYDGFYVNYSSGAFGAGVAFNSTFATSTLTASASTWHHVAAVFASATSRTIYVDGVAGTPNTTNATPVATPSCATVGGFNLTGTLDPTNFYTGSADEVRWNNTALSAAWIAADYNSQKTSPSFYSISSPSGSGAGGSLSTRSPTSVVISTTGNVITLTGSGTAWTAGTPGTPTFTLSGGTGASITAQTVASSTSATITVTAGSTAGTLTITDPSNSTTLTLTVTAPTNFIKDAAPRKLYSSSSNPATCPVGTVYFKTGVTAGQNLYGCTSADTWTQLGGSGGSSYNQTILSDSSTLTQRAKLKFAAGSNITLTPTDNGTDQTTVTIASTGGGGGASSVPQLTDLQVTKTNATTLTVTIGNVMVGGVSYSIPAGTVVVTAGSPTVRIAVDTSVTPPIGKVYYSSGTVTCSGMGGCTTPVSGSAFGVDDIQIASWTSTSVVWDTSGGTDLRGMLSKTRTLNGTGISSSISGHTQTLSINTAVLPIFTLTPGTGSNLASGGTISPTNRTHHVTGSSAIATITATSMTDGEILTLIPDGAFTTTTGGNVGKASTGVVSQAMRLVWDANLSKWFPSY